MIKLNVGCCDVLFPNWDNIDKNPHNGVIVHDARHRFPYEDNSVDYIFSEHFIEHLTESEGQSYFEECYRMLKPGGVVRTSTFDFDTLIKNCKDDISWKEYSQKLYGGQFSHLSRMDFLNLAIYEGENHKHMYNVPEMRRMLASAGFNSYRFPKMRLSIHEEFKNKEWRMNSDCIVEATK
jgi:predicted SAM-dependent methyltransferase